MPEPLLNVVIETVARYYALSPDLLRDKTRVRSAKVARHTAMYVARLAGEFSYPQIGEAFGHRHHTTVMNAVRKCALRAQADDGYRIAVDNLVRDVQGIGIIGGPVRIRAEIRLLLEERVSRGIFAATVEDLVDRILCEYFQREGPR